MFSGNTLASSPIPDHSRAAAHRLIGQYTKNLLTWHRAREEGEVGTNPWFHCHQGICLGVNARPWPMAMDRVPRHGARADNHEWLHREPFGHGPWAMECFLCFITFVPGHKDPPQRRLPHARACGTLPIGASQCDQVTYVSKCD